LASSSGRISFTRLPITKLTARLAMPPAIKIEEQQGEYRPAVTSSQLKGPADSIQRACGARG
jgi:hypothetical protein